jgi:hypothetical protein
MADTTGRIPLWVIGTVAGILVIGAFEKRRRIVSIQSPEN